MPQDADTAPDQKATASGTKPKREEQQIQWFATPPPIKRLFDRFPLITYPPNDLPQRTPKSRDQHALYIFTTEEGAARGAPSFNPSCLKWQTYLKFKRIPFITVPSNNHASPTGALPFLLPATTTTTTSSSSIPGTAAAAVVPSHRIQRWTRDILAQEKPDNSTRPSYSKHNGQPEGSDDSSPENNMRYTAYLSLLEHRIRPAYLYTLYLHPRTFSTLTTPLYIHPLTLSQTLRLHLSHTLRTTAFSEILKTAHSHSQSGIIDPETLYKESDKAFEALSELLGGDEWFFGAEEPGLFDACVFAYVGVLLDEGLGLGEGSTGRVLRGGRCGNLVGFWERVLRVWYGGEKVVVEESH